MISVEKARQLSAENSFVMKEISQAVESAAKSGQNIAVLEKRYGSTILNALRYMGYVVEETEEEFEEYSDLRKEYFSRFVDGTRISW